MSRMAPEEQPDFFIASAMRPQHGYRSDRLLLQMSLFGNNKKPSKEEKHVRTEVNGIVSSIRVTPSHEGLATLWDFDPLVYFQTVIVDRMNRGLPTSRTIQFNIYDALKFMGRGTSGKDYDAFHAALRRLHGTMVYTNIKAGDRTIDSGFGWLQSFALSKRELPSGKIVMEKCQVTLCDWIYRMLVEDKTFLALRPEYLQIDSGIFRKMFMIINARIGSEDSWWISVEKMHEMTGSTGKLSRFAFELRQSIERDDFPVWRLYLSTDSRGPLYGGKIVPPVPGSRDKAYLYVYRRKSSIRAPLLR